jgi:hypothetical protein
MKAETNKEDTLKKPRRLFRARSQAVDTSRKAAGRFQIHWVIGSGWVHTHGMAERGFPEIEAQEVPDFLAEAASRIIHHVCDYMLDTGTRIKPGEVMEVSPRTRFRLVAGEPIPGEEDHYRDERLRIVDVEHACDVCKCKPSELN